VFADRGAKTGLEPGRRSSISKGSTLWVPSRVTEPAQRDKTIARHDRPHHMLIRVASFPAGFSMRCGKSARCLPAAVPCVYTGTHVTQAALLQRLGADVARGRGRGADVAADAVGVRVVAGHGRPWVREGVVAGLGYDAGYFFLYALIFIAGTLNCLPAHFFRVLIIGWIL
jgi:hypothetical protein